MLALPPSPVSVNLVHRAHVSVIRGIRWHEGILERPARARTLRGRVLHDGQDALRPAVGTGPRHRAAGCGVDPSRAARVASPGRDVRRARTYLLPGGRPAGP